MCSEHSGWPTVGQNQNKAYFITVLNVSCNLLNAALTVTHRMGVSVLVVSPLDQVAGQEPLLPPPGITRQNPAAYHWPRKRSKINIQSTDSPECIVPLWPCKIEKELRGTIGSWGLTFVFSFFAYICSCAETYRRTGQ